VRELVATLDWSATPLGPMALWPAELRSAVDIMLGAAAQIVMFCGSDLVAIYNDAYTSTIGNKHPQALGRPARENWAELWTDLEPMLRRVLSSGETIAAKDHPFVIERGRGSENVFFDISYSPVLDAGRQVLAVFCIVTETTERFRAQDIEKRLAAIMRSTSDAILGTDLAMTITSWNAGAEALYGYAAAEVLGRSVFILIPEHLHAAEHAIFDSISRGEPIDSHETVRLRRDGTLVDVSLTVSPIYDGAGTIVGASKIARDISAKKEAERLQGMLMGELKHRIKNVLATVTAIARQTFGAESGNREAVRAFEERLEALSGALDLLTQGSWNSSELGRIVEETLAPYDRARFHIEGPIIAIAPQPAIGLALALHELATNAAKYGALCVETGQVRLSWSLDRDGAGFSVRWQETGGPPVAPPTRRGFGSLMIQRLLGSYLGGEVQLKYEPSGVVCEISAPLTA
jgi:PAS domain S-box-containing protein